MVPDVMIQIDIRIYEEVVRMICATIGAVFAMWCVVHIIKTIFGAKDDTDKAGH